MQSTSRVCARIDLDALEHNIDEIERLISPGTGICAVIKTDGYGHGAVPVAKLLEERESVWGYAVATAAEAMALKEAGLLKPVLILGYVFKEDLEVVVENGIRPTVFSAESAGELSRTALALDKTVRIHVKADTGMGRIGFPCTERDTEATADEIERIASLPRIEIEGLYTHFAAADTRDKTFSMLQAGRFEALSEALKERGISIPLHHISNSAAVIDLPGYNLDLVRAGIILYGLFPSDEVMRERIDLKPVMSVKSHVVHVKELHEGDTVSYGGTYRVKGTEQIATIPVGYGDGYPRALSNVGSVLIRGKRAPVCGRICMDQFMVNVTGIPGVKTGDQVTLIGRDGEEEITMEELGELSGRFNYEFACDIGKRVPRVCVRGNCPV